MKRVLNFIALVVTGAVTLISCTYNELTNPYGELNIIFDTEKVSLNAGEAIEVPFTVTGTDGAALDFEPSSDNSKVKCKLSKIDYDNAQGVILVSASKTISSDIEAQVFLKVSDSHHRKLTRFVDVSVTGNGGGGSGEEPGGEKGDDDYGDLGIFFDTSAPAINPGQTLEIPFTVTGSEGATLDLVPSVDNSDYSCALGKVDYVNYQGTIKLTAPEVITEATEVKVSLTASDTHKRSLTKSVSVKVNASEPLTITVLGEPASMAVKAGGSFSLSYKVLNLAPAKITGTPTVEVSSGWSTEVSVSEDIIKVKYNAPASIGQTLEIKISATDDHNRKVEYSGSLSIVEITTTAGAANCHVVKPGGTLTIKAVKGNSTTALEFDNATLVWQDAIGLVSSVSGNGSEGVVVVRLADGKEGNAVVAARDGDRIVWSWHVWVTDYDPEADIFEWTDANGITYKYMDRNLGALSAEKYSKESLGLMYQWGRKDPFPGGDDVESQIQKRIYDINGNQIYMKIEERPTYNDNTSTNLQLAIEHPDVFYGAPSSSWPVVDWLTDKAALQNNDLWGGKTNAKTVYDPCPEGWRIPAAGNGWGFRTEYKKKGSLNDDGEYDESYPWFQDYDKCIGFRYKTKAGKEYWFPLVGKLDPNNGTLQSVGGSGYYNTCTDNSNTVFYECLAWGNPASESMLNRTHGAATRCIKE
uniref:COG1470 family protein n=1 Tax=Candidatus Cryptobacteroides bacterium TaxID=3085639 RepID=UPI004025504E